MELPSLLGGRRRLRFLRLVAIGGGQAVAGVATVLLVRHAFDELLSGGDPAAATPLLLALLAAAALTAGLRFAERVVAEQLGQDYVRELRLVLYDRLSSLAPRTLQRRSQGGVLLRFVGDLTALRQWVSLGLARLLVAAIAGGGALLALMTVSVSLGLAVAAVLSVALGASLHLGGHLRRAVEEARRHRTHLAANVSEKVATMAVVQVFGQSLRERRRVARQSGRLGDAMVQRARVTGALRAITEGTAGAAVVVALALGAHEVAAGRTTAGAVVAAMTLVGLLLPPLRDLSRVYEYWQGARVSRHKILQFLETRSLVTEAPDALRLRPGPGLLRFEGVRVKGALEPLTLEATPGSVTAIVGPNGAGKSTLLTLAARIVDPDRGRVRLDGRNLARVRLDAVRRAVGMVSSDLPLLRGSIDYNLRYRWPDAPEEEVARVSALCGVDELLAELPEGAATRLAEGGANLSPGQRQRIALARAILGDPRVLLLDEADANLDPKSAQALGRVLAGYRGTVLMVTHRLDRLAAAHRIWHLEGGRLVEAGPPEELLSSDGPTAHLFRRPWAQRQAS